LQPGGHRFDPGQLHQKIHVLEAVLMMQAILGLGMWLVPIVAIAVWGILEGVKLVLAHQERLAMIERGMHPDSVKKNEPA
jgi:uncharacterized membrane protein